MKVKDLKEGMENLDMILKIDYIPPAYSRSTKWGIIFVEDDTKDIKMILTGEDYKRAKEGMKIRIKNGYVTKSREQLQLNTKEPIEFIEYD